MILGTHVVIAVRHLDLPVSRQWGGDRATLVVAVEVVDAEAAVAVQAATTAGPVDVRVAVAVPSVVVAAVATSGEAGAVVEHSLGRSAVGQLAAEVERCRAEGGPLDALDAHETDGVAAAAVVAVAGDSEFTVSDRNLRCRGGLMGQNGVQQTRQLVRTVPW